MIISFFERRNERRRYYPNFLTASLQALPEEEEGRLQLDLTDALCVTPGKAYLPQHGDCPGRWRLLRSYSRDDIVRERDGKAPSSNRATIGDDDV